MLQWHKRLVQDAASSAGRWPAIANAANRLVIRPMRSLGLLSVAHAVNHAQAVILPLIYLKIIDEFHVGVETIAFLAAVGGLRLRRWSS